MRYLFLGLVCLVASFSIQATEIDDIEGLRAAINAHESALLSGDASRISETVLYPHVQFYRDGRVVNLQKPEDLPFRSEAQRQWRVSNSSLVMYEPGVAIVRTSFERTEDTEVASVGAGLWCFTRVEGEWRIVWRHYLGPDADL